MALFFTVRVELLHHRLEVMVYVTVPAMLHVDVTVLLYQVVVVVYVVTVHQLLLSWNVASDFRSLTDSQPMIMDIARALGM